MYRWILGLVVALAAVGFGVSAQATTLQFHDSSVSGPQVSGADLNCISTNSSGCYGDRATGATSPLGTSYVPDANTPNIAASYSGAFRQWNNGFGTSTYLSTDNSSASYITLKADAGFAIKLTSITLDIEDLFGASNTGHVNIFNGGIPGVGDPALLSLAISGNAPVTTALNLIAGQFTFQLPNTNYGIQFLSFDQVVAATTPIPAALPLFASALAGLGVFGWRRKKAAAAA